MLILNIVPFLLLLTITQANVNLYVLADNFLNGSAVVVGNYDNVLDNSTLSIGTDPTYLYYDSRYITYYPGGSPVFGGYWYSMMIANWSWLFEDKTVKTCLVQ